MRGRMDESEKHYTTNFDDRRPARRLGGRPGGRQPGADGFAAGDFVRHRLGWRDYAVVDAAAATSGRRRACAPLPDLARRARPDRLHRLRRAAARRRAARRRRRVRLRGAAGRGRQRGRPVRPAARRVTGDRQRRRPGEGAAARRRARLRRRHRLPRRPARRTGRRRARRHRPVLRQRRRRASGRGAVRAQPARPGRAVRRDLDDGGHPARARRAAPDPGRAQAAHAARLHRARPRGPAPGVRAAGQRLVAHRRARLASRPSSTVSTTPSTRSSGCCPARTSARCSSAYRTTSRPSRRGDHVDNTVPPEVADLAKRTRDFVRDVVIPVELQVARRRARRARTSCAATCRARRATPGCSPRTCPREWGGCGLDVRGQSVVFEEAGYSLLGPLALNCTAPDEGNMHLLEVVATEEQKEQLPAPARRRRDPVVLRDDRARTRRRLRPVDAGDDRDARSTAAGASTAASGSSAARTAPASRSAWPARAATPASAAARRCSSSTPTTPACGWCATSRPSTRGCSAATARSSSTTAASVTTSVLGEVDRGFQYAQVRLAPARLTHCMRWLGLARRAHDIAVDWAATRKSFGGLLGDLGMVQQLIADSEIDIAASRALIRQTAAVLDSGERGGTESSIAKTFVAEAVNRVVDRSVQICGALGISGDVLLSRYLREVRPFRIYDGPSEVHRWAIARRAISARRRAIEAGETPRVADDRRERAGHDRRRSGRRRRCSPRSTRRVLPGSRCATCGTVAFPVPTGCAKCAGSPTWHRSSSPTTARCGRGPCRTFEPKPPYRSPDGRLRAVRRRLRRTSATSSSSPGWSATRPSSRSTRRCG